ncbi:MAG: hypothetical protein OXF09_02015 [Hyphomicrobiales bacterium]|nr:hypothetical protein [Hyphomicrobiales bacterium]
MKATLTMAIFALGVFMTPPAFAKVEGDCEGWNIWGPNCGVPISKIDELEDPSQEGNERDVADSGEEGSTSAASEGGINAIRVSDDTSDKIGKEEPSGSLITTGQ